MTVTLELPPDIEASLLAHAEAEGLGVADYLRNLVRKEIAANSLVHPKTVQCAPKKKRLSELFASLAGVDLDLNR